MAQRHLRFTDQPTVLNSGGIGLKWVLSPFMYWNLLRQLKARGAWLHRHHMRSSHAIVNTRSLSGVFNGQSTSLVTASYAVVPETGRNPQLCKILFCLWGSWLFKIFFLLTYSHTMLRDTEFDWFFQKLSTCGSYCRMFFYCYDILLLNRVLI